MLNKSSSVVSPNSNVEFDGAPPVVPVIESLIPRRVSRGNQVGNQTLTKPFGAHSSGVF